MWYVFFAEDKPDTLEQRLKARPMHLQRLEALQSEGRLLVAGPCPAFDGLDPGPAGFTGSVVIAEFKNLAEAQAWADQDPYVEAGIYQNIIVKPFKKVLP